MIDTTTSAVTTGVIVIAGRWSLNQPIDIRVVTGGLFLAMSLSVLTQINENLAGTFGMSILIAALLMYSIPIATKLGWMPGKKPARTGDRAG